MTTDTAQRRRRTARFVSDPRGSGRVTGGSALQVPWTRQPNHTIAVEREKAEQRMRTYGSPIDVEPHAALIEEVRRTAGHVAWLNGVVSDLLHEGDGYSESIHHDGKRTLR